jgi:hypothetical protein
MKVVLRTDSARCYWLKTFSRAAATSSHTRPNMRSTDSPGSGIGERGGEQIEGASRLDPTKSHIRHSLHIRDGAVFLPRDFAVGNMVVTAYTWDLFRDLPPIPPHLPA